MTQPVFAAVVRTMGNRSNLLRESLESLTFQELPCIALVVVHGGNTAVEDVRRLCESIKGLEFSVLHASDRNKKRGYPLNVGLQQCYESTPADFICFLDDDDIVYPFFTRALYQSFLTSGADVVYAGSNRREGLAPAAAGYRPRPVFELLYENFIPINSYAIRVEPLRASGVTFDETFEYTEDWRFLIALLEHGFRFHADLTTLSEFRIISDGNRGEKSNAQLWKRHSLQIRSSINHSCFRIPGAALVATSQPIEPRLVADGSGNPKWFPGDTNFKAIAEKRGEYIGELEEKMEYWAEEARRSHEYISELEARIHDLELSNRSFQREYEAVVSCLSAFERTMVQNRRKIASPPPDTVWQRVQRLIGKPPAEAVKP